MSAGPAVLDAAFQAHERPLWNLCYRMTGVAADADDLVQETFLRAMERPPARPEGDLRPWLVRVAMNLARDLLRRRRRRQASGVWLPSPIETGEDAAPAYEPSRTEGRYDLLESCTFAFLLALEALTPQQRAVLLLRDVFDYSVEETAEALDLSVPNVKTTHHRARRAMTAYDTSRRPPTRALQEATLRVLGELTRALVQGDAPAIEALLASDVRTVTDGGTFHAARKPIVGRERVAHFYRRLAELGGGTARLSVRMVNGLPALVMTLPDSRPGYPPHGIIRIDLDDDGKVRTIHSVLATGKLTAIGCPASRDHPGTGPSALWTIVSRCVDRQTTAYCSCPAFELSCCGNQSTPDADVVWARTADFVVIRDLRMCGCPPDFVSALAMPLTRITGIEDARRPEGIWPFAWDVARTHIPDELAIGLVLNPPAARTQNQMHVHLVRLQAGVRPWLDGDAPAPPGVQVVPVPGLDAVFAAVQARVGAEHMRDTGVLVARARSGGWRAVLTDRTSPQVFTVNRCVAQ